MKLCTFEVQGRQVPGILDESNVWDMGRVAAAQGIPWEGPLTLLAIVQAGDDGTGFLTRVNEAKGGSAAVYSLEDVQLVAPLPRPLKNIFCVGRNYAEHVSERGADAPEHPVFFTKAPTTVVGPDETVPYPKWTEKFDYEAEVGVIIGRAGRDIARADALDYIFGYTVINDLTARDLQRRHTQWFKGKSLDKSCPMGPWIVTKDEVPDPQTLDIGLQVNGELRQKSNTAQMIFPIAQIIEVLSRGMTLEPGDVIASGTPSGVGAAGDGSGLLKPGDVIEAWVERIGTLRTSVGDQA